MAGFDFTFSVPKSVSALWGVADVGIQALIVEAHHQALVEVLGFLEREVATTRRGVDAKDGAVVCFFRGADKFKERYMTLGFNDNANLDEGTMWPIAFALKELTAAEEERIAALVRKAVS